jgi:CRP-like cAMP-binding protein
MDVVVPEKRRGCKRSRASLLVSGRLLRQPAGAMAGFSDSPRFGALDLHDRDRLDVLSKLDEFPPGAVLSRGDQPSEWLQLIAAGEVELLAPTSLGDRRLALLGPGDILGELELFAHLPAGVRHVAKSDTIVRAVPKGPLKFELLARRSLALGLLSVYARSISEKLRSASEAAARASLRISHPGEPPPRPAGEAPMLGPLGRPSHLSAEEAGWLAVMGQTLEVEAGATVVAEGDRSRDFYVVEAGRLEVRKRVTGRAGGQKAQQDAQQDAELEPLITRPIAQLSDRDLFGFMAFVDGQPRSASVVALGPCRLARIEPSALEKALKMNFTVSFKFLGTLCGVLGRTLRETTLQVMAT